MGSSEGSLCPLSQLATGSAMERTPATTASHDRCVEGAELPLASAGARAAASAVALRSGRSKWPRSITAAPPAGTAAAASTSAKADRNLAGSRAGETPLGPAAAGSISIPAAGGAGNAALRGKLWPGGGTMGRLQSGQLAETPRCKTQPCDTTRRDVLSCCDGKQACA